MTILQEVWLGGSFFLFGLGLGALGTLLYFGSLPLPDEQTTRKLEKLEVRVD